MILTSTWNGLIPGPIKTGKAYENSRKKTRFHRFAAGAKRQSRKARPESQASVIRQASEEKD